MPRKIGISILSFLSPTLLFSKDYGYVAEILTSLDIGVQLLPLRGLQKDHVEKFEVLSFEGPWRFGTVRDLFYRHVLGNKERASILDLLLFGTEKRCRASVQMLAETAPRALVIDTPWVPTSSIELGPEMYYGKARQWEHKPDSIVLDTGHWHEFKNGDAERALEAFGGMAKVRMVHVKYKSKADVVSFFKQNDTNASLLKEFLRHDTGQTIPIVIEAYPGTLNALGTVRETIHALSNRIREITV